MIRGGTENYCRSSVAVYFKRWATQLEKIRPPSLRDVAWTIASPQVVFFLLALAIMGPLLAPGRILALDSLLAFNFNLSGYFWGTSDGPESVFAATYNSAPVASILRLFDYVLPFWVVEKIWLLLLFLLCGLGAFRLPYLYGAGRYYAGLFYAVNPFTYIRFVTGQWGVLGAYALLPFAVTAFVRLLEEPRPRHAISTALLLTAISFLQIHGLILTVLVLVALYIGRMAVLPGSWKSSLPSLLLVAVLFLAINAFWLVRYAITQGGAVNNMPVGEMSYFAAYPPLDVLSLRGFWLSEAYVDISGLVPTWWVLFLPLLFLAIYGIFVMIENRGLRWLALGMGIMAVTSLVLAAGPGVPTVQPPFQWLWEHAPWYRAFRDSHKFAGLLALAYAYFGAVGVQSFWNSSRSRVSGFRRLTYPGLALALLAVIIYGLPIFGAWGQLKPTEFPKDWHQVRSILDSDSEDYNVLVLPWHMYMNFSWLPNHWNRLVNPAPSFFSQPTISGDNIEVGVNFSNSSNPQSKYVETLLRRRESVEDFGDLIAPMNAKYVVLFKDGDYQSYSFLREQDDLDLVFDGETIALFRNMRPTARLYAVNDVVQIASEDEYIISFGRWDPLGSLYVISPVESGFLPHSPDESRPSAQVRAEMLTPARYKVEQFEGEYLVFTLPQHTVRSGWEHEGSESDLLNLGMMPTFPPGPGSSAITHTHFYKLYLPTYALTVASILAVTFVYWRRRRST